MHVVVQSLSRVYLFCNPMDCNPPGSSVHGISQPRRLNGLLFPSPGDLSNIGIEPKSPDWQGDSLPQNHQGSQKNAYFCKKKKIIFQSPSLIPAGKKFNKVIYFGILKISASSPPTENYQ